MPTILKLALDAEEYKRDLEAVIAETRAAAQALGETQAKLQVTADTEQAKSELSDLPQAQDQHLTVTADTEQAKADLLSLSDGSDLSEVRVTVTGSTNAGEVAAEARGALESVEDRSVSLTVTNDVAASAETALDSIPDHKDVNITIPEVKPVSISVIADTVKIAELKAQIAELEDKEITAQVKVVDDQIALLQKELDAIQSKDITVTTEADVEEAEKLKAVIAALQDKKIQIRTEVHSEQLDSLRNQLQETQAGAGKFGMSFRNLIPAGFGAQIRAGAGAVSAIGAAAGASVPPVGMLAAAVNALLSPISLVVALLTALVAIGMAVWDKLTVSAEEYAEKTKAAADEAKRQAEKVKEQDQAAQGYITRLREIAEAESIGNAAKTETLQLLSNLESQYGDLGAVIDETTGKIVNLAEVEERANAARRKKRALSLNESSEAQMAEARASYMKVRGGGWFDGMTEAGAGRLFDWLQKNLSPEQLLRQMELQARNATTSDEINGYNDVAAKIRAALESRNKGRNVRNTGYETTEEYQAALAKKSQQVGQAQAANIQLDRAAERRRADNALHFMRDSDDKIANRQGLLDAEKKRQAVISEEVFQAEVDVAFAGDDPEKKLDAEKRLLEAQARYKQSQSAIAELEQQIAQIRHEQAEAKRKLNEQANYELDYNELIIAGEYDKAAALKLEYELKQQNLKLTEEEKKELLEMQKARAGQESGKRIADAQEEVRLQRLLLAGNYEEYEAARLAAEARKAGRELSPEEEQARLAATEEGKQLKLQKSLYDQADALLGQAKKANGQGTEYERQKALRDAEKAKGGKLTEEETQNVEMLFSLTERLKDLQSEPGVRGMTDVKTNALTARGGFSGAVRLPDTERYNREIAQSGKRQAELLTGIKTLVEKLGKF